MSIYKSNTQKIRAKHVWIADTSETIIKQILLLAKENKLPFKGTVKAK